MVGHIDNYLNPNNSVHGVCYSIARRATFLKSTAVRWQRNGRGCATLRNVNTGVDAVREALIMKARTLSVCLCLSLSGFALQSQIANANLRPAGINLFRNIELRMRVLIAPELICNCECEFLLFWN